MTRRAWLGFAALALLDAVVWILTIHSHLTFHRSADGPSVMPVSQLLGWVFSIAILLLLVFSAVSTYRRLRRG